MYINVLLFHLMLGETRCLFSVKILEQISCAIQELNLIKYYTLIDYNCSAQRANCLLSSTSKICAFLHHHQSRDPLIRVDNIKSLRDSQAQIRLRRTYLTSTPFVFLPPLLSFFLCPVRDRIFLISSSVYPKADH